MSPSKSASPARAEPQGVRDENIFHDTKPAVDRTAALRSLAGRLRNSTQGGAMRVPGYVPSERPPGRAAPEHTPSASPFKPSPRKLQRPTRFASTGPAKRVWDSPEADSQKRKRDDESSLASTTVAIEDARERLRRRTSLRVAERQKVPQSQSQPQSQPQPQTMHTAAGPASHAVPKTVAATPAVTVPPRADMQRPELRRTSKALAQQALMSHTPRVARQLPQTPSRRVSAVPVQLQQPNISRRMQLSDHEVASLTARNTKANQGYTVVIETRVERMRGNRPTSPEPHFCGGHGVVSRKGRQGSATKHARGAGDDHEYKSPPRIVRCVRWDKQLVTSPSSHEPRRNAAPRPCIRHTNTRDHIPTRADAVTVVRRVYDDDGDLGGDSGA
ncbi:hypothetical protein MCUN1_002700 [Malassezia cuniculi]|uniref:Uncharacterized protein n=1 Tax=Malassezia cuniculi TaxID=948313 RepID=A0AAF0J6R5_9BASI|nr:hypothetical protein MCUN1_002700 [Malassezia cuniculi]